MQSLLDCNSFRSTCICLYLMLRLKAIHLLNYFSMDRSAYCLIYLNNKPSTLTNDVTLASGLSNINTTHTLQCSPNISHSFLNNEFFETANLNHFLQALTSCRALSWDWWTSSTVAKCPSMVNLG